MVQLIKEREINGGWGSALVVERGLKGWVGECPYERKALMPASWLRSGAQLLWI